MRNGQKVTEHLRNCYATTESEKSVRGSRLGPCHLVRPYQNLLEPAMTTRVKQHFVLCETQTDQRKTEKLGFPGGV